WSKHARLVDPDDSKALFIINPDMDCPPRYKSLIRGESLDNSLGLDTRALVSNIKNFMLEGNDYSGDLNIPGTLGIELLQHVSQSWGDLAERTFNRIPSQG
ncbi:MAG TPA: molecular chaperone, partial [Pseudomonas sp.]|nr:molecular chaperone [Pseudomonas sp.]